MQTSFRSFLAIAAAAASIGVPGLSRAALTPADMVLAPTEVGMSVPTTDSERYLVQAANLLVGIAPPPSLKIGLEEARPVMRSVLSGKPVLVELRGPSDLALWNLIATVHAQQRNNVFELVNTGAQTVREIEREQVSPVPLPGVLWLFALGLAGLAGTRTRRQEAASAAVVATGA